MSDVVISIKPQFVDLIFAGRKTIELRKTSARLQPGTRALIYATSPRCAVVGEATITARHQLPLDELWRRFGSRAAVSEALFRSYYQGSDEGVGFELAPVVRYAKPVPLAELRRLGDGFRPPQSYMRLPKFLARLAERRIGFTIGGEQQAIAGI